VAAKAPLDLRGIRLGDGRGGSGLLHRRLPLGPRIDADAGGPGLPLRGKFFHLFRVGGGEVVQLGAILREIVEFPLFDLRAIRHGDVFADEFPVAVPDRGVGLVFGEDRFAALQWNARESRTQGDAVERHGLHPRSLRRIGRPGDIEQGRHHIDELGGVAIPSLARRDLRGPMEEEGRRRSALVEVVLVEPEGRAACVRPGLAVAVVVLFVALRDIVEFATTEHAALLAGAVVGEKEKQGVFVGAAFLQRSDELAHVLVDPVDHRGEDGHLQVHLIALRLVERSPSRGCPRSSARAATRDRSGPARPAGGGVVHEVCPSRLGICRGTSRCPPRGPWSGQCGAV
jgi:hypothetical protein